MRRILIIKLWALGDIIMATPMLNALKMADPEIKITWLVDSTHADVIIGHPLVDEVIVFDSAIWRKQLRSGNVVQWALTAFKLKVKLRERKFDAAINCHPDKRWTRMFTVGRVTVGLYPFDVDRATGGLYTQAIGRPIDPRVHNTIHYLLATRSLGLPDSDLRLSLPSFDRESGFVASFIDSLEEVSNKKLIFVAPFSTAENRNWPIEKYIELCCWLNAACGANIILSGTPRDKDRIDQIIERLGSRSAKSAVGTTVAQYIALIQRSNLVISSDSSPMHIAAASDIPFLTLFGATPVDERMPLVGRGKAVFKRIPCAPCDRTDCSQAEFRKCMKLITVNDVQEAALDLLA